MKNRFKKYYKNIKKVLTNEIICVIMMSQRRETSEKREVKDRKERFRNRLQVPVAAVR